MFVFQVSEQAPKVKNEEKILGVLFVDEKPVLVSPEQATGPEYRIYILSTTWCPPCKKLKEFLEESGYKVNYLVQGAGVRIEGGVSKQEQRDATRLARLLKQPVIPTLFVTDAEGRVIRPGGSNSFYPGYDKKDQKDILKKLELLMPNKKWRPLLKKEMGSLVPVKADQNARV